jgi:DNA polymerase-3 subunit delta'
MLVSHAPGRLLRTIRSRCRRLDLDPLSNDTMTSLLSHWFSDEKPEKLAALVDLSAGSPGRALEAANLDLAPLEAAAKAIMTEGDPTNARRSKLASDLAGKGAADRYAAFLAMVPSLLAREARETKGRRRQLALDAYAKARETSAIAPRLSLDPAFTVFQLGGVLASVALKG